MSDIRWMLLSLLSAFGVVLGGAQARAVPILGADYGGANLTVANGDVLSGTFTNIGTFSIPVGVTAYVAQGVPLSITAANFALAGTLNATGAGFAGGPAVTNTTGCQTSGTPSGNTGAGPGGGSGGPFGSCTIGGSPAFSAIGSGGGGGGYGDQGGTSGQVRRVPAGAPGGLAYGNPLDAFIDMGSGGGSGSRYDADTGSSGAGGAGGGSISLSGGTIVLTGALLANGAPGTPGVPMIPLIGTAGGGGGAGGGILLSGDLFLDGLLSVDGGMGGNGGTNSYGSGGGGGAGGRIKLFGTTSLGTNFAFSTEGGAAGSSYIQSWAMATPGGSGSVHRAATVPEPYALMLIGFGLVAAGLAVRQPKPTQITATDALRPRGRLGRLLGRVRPA